MIYSIIFAFLFEKKGTHLNALGDNKMQLLTPTTTNQPTTDYLDGLIDEAP